MGSSLSLHSRSSSAPSPSPPAPSAAWPLCSSRSARKEIARVGEAERGLQTALPRDVVELEGPLQRQRPAFGGDVKGVPITPHVDPAFALLHSHAVVQGLGDETVPWLVQRQSVVAVRVLRIKA